MTRPCRLVVTALCIPVLLMLPDIRDFMEASMLRHMLGVFPLLVCCGLALAFALPTSLHTRLAVWNWGGVSGLIVSVALLTTWMIPNALDGATESVSMDVLKTFSLVLAGLAMGISMPIAPLAIQLFFVWNGVMMLVFVGVLYQSLPTRLCSAYLIDDQATTGLYLVILAVLLGLIWLSCTWQRLQFGNTQ